MLQKTIPANLAPDDHSAYHHPESHSVFGFWLYLMTDCIIFAALFAVFAVMSHQFAGGATAKDLFEIIAVESRDIHASRFALTRCASRGRRRT